VVIPAYDEKVLIESTLLSIPGYVDKVYAVDDCSSNGTLDKMRLIALRDPRITVIHHEVNGGVKAETLYLFYGEEDLTDTLFTHLLAQGLKPTDRYPKPEAAYVICGNYRVEHIIIDTEPLIQLIEATGQDPEDALKQVRVLVASSTDQQANLTAELERVMKSSKDMRLVLVKGIYKLGRDDARKRNRGRVHEEVQRSIEEDLRRGGCPPRRLRQGKPSRGLPDGPASL
jgi:hypothetical protein